MEDARPRVAAAALALLSAFVLATCGAPGAPSRDEIVDSRDIYDPRSLDPALSTDVPTGRHRYLFDGLTRFTPDARRTVARHAETSTAATFHLRTDVCSTTAPLTAERRRQPGTRARSGDEERRGAVPVSNRRRASLQRRDGQIHRRTDAPNDSTVVVTLDEPPRSSPRCWRCPSPPSSR
jgi:peptide/nickel transport system substrate-binding protein/oligopeptide transport system substrate-binding protein